MATRLRDDARVTREIEAIDDRGRRTTYMVVIAREGIYMREKGKRTAFGPLPWSRVAWEATKATQGMPSIPGPAKPRGRAKRVTIERNLLTT